MQDEAVVVPHVHRLQEGGVEEETFVEGRGGILLGATERGLRG